MLKKLFILAFLHSFATAHASSYLQKNNAKSLSFVAPTVGGVANVPTEETPGLIVLDANDGVFKGKGWDGTFHNLGSTGQALAIRAISANDNILNADDVIIATNAITITLPDLSGPTAVASGKIYEIRNNDSTTKSIGVQSGDAFQGNSETTTLLKLQTSGDYIRLVADTTNRKWHFLADQRTVAARYKATGLRNPTASKAVNYDTMVYDTHGAVTAMSGDTAGWKFTAPINGLYRVSVSSYCSTTSATTTNYIYLNGSTQDAALTTGTNNNANSGSATVRLNAGEYIDFRSDGTPTFGSASNLNTISIERIGN